jgi:hypothetical protein
MCVRVSVCVFVVCCVCCVCILTNPKHTFIKISSGESINDNEPHTHTHTHTHTRTHTHTPHTRHIHVTLTHTQTRTHTSHTRHTHTQGQHNYSAYQLQQPTACPRTQLTACSNLIQCVRVYTTHTHTHTHTRTHTHTGLSRAIDKRCIDGLFGGEITQVHGRYTVPDTRSQKYAHTKCMNARRPSPRPPQWRRRHGYTVLANPINASTACSRTRFSDLIKVCGG